MIRYIGGKVKIAEDIYRCINKYRTDKHTEYIEPFVGGGGMFIATSSMSMPRHFRDIDSKLIELYQALQSGWLPPERVSEELYKKCKKLDDCPLRTYVGYACSFGGKFYGGLARDRQTGRDLSNESYKRVIRTLPHIQNVNTTFSCLDYKLTPVNEQCLIYCDPPYKDSEGYQSGSFDTDIFWETVRKWYDKGAMVLVSEFEAPDDFVSIWSKKRNICIHTETTNNTKTENVFVHHKFIKV